jgi:hypothetical protein
VRVVVIGLIGVALSGELPTEGPAVPPPAAASDAASDAASAEPPGARAARLERRHLARLGVLAGASAVAGGVVAGVGWEDPRLQSAGLMTVGWAAVDAVIVAAAWKSTARPRTAEELAASREFLQLNLGLDVGYVATGVAMGVLGRMDGRPAVEGAGWAVAAQGLSLAVLDGILLAELPKRF